MLLVWDGVGMLVLVCDNVSGCVMVCGGCGCGADGVSGWVLGGGGNGGVGVLVLGCDGEGCVGGCGVGVKDLK